MPFSRSRSSRSSHCPGKKGEDWSGKLYFDPDTSDKTKDLTGYYVEDGYKLRVELLRLIGANEKINHVWIYTTPLSDKQLTHVIFYHAYVVMETNTHWWSLEKNTKELVLQRSKTLEHVKDYCQGEKRKLLVSQSEPQLWKHQESNLSLLNLFHALWKTDELKSTYNWLVRNCQGFANRIFNSCAVSKKKKCSDRFDPSKLGSKCTVQKAIPLCFLPKTI